MDMGQALETALEFEKEGFQIYTEAADNTEHSVIEKTFRYLADQEVNHIEEIKQFIEKNDPDVELKGDQLPEVKKKFGEIISEHWEKTELSDSDIEAHKAGMDFEKKAYEFYKKELEETDDEMAKKFFKFLMEQEQAHYELIEKTYDYIKNPEAWYAEEEGWIEEGGGM
jgi:rubrerythrin